MGYMHIENLYRNQEILLFKDCYAMEKLHGTSAGISWDGTEIAYHSGATKQARFEALFDHAALTEQFRIMGHPKMHVFGEAYGGSVNRMAHVYGAELRFAAFDVQIGEHWLAVHDMAQVCYQLGLGYVSYSIVPTTVDMLDRERTRPSEHAAENGMGEQMREGVVLRPLIEVTKNDGRRIIAKYKNDEFEERAHPPKVVDEARLQVLADATAIAEEWVTEMRLTHVLDKFPGAGMERMGDIIKAMIADVYREGSGEIIESREASSAIGKRTVALFKSRLT